VKIKITEKNYANLLAAAEARKARTLTPAEKKGHYLAPNGNTARRRKLKGVAGYEFYNADTKKTKFVPGKFQRARAVVGM